MDDSVTARMQAEHEALQFECDLLRREGQRLVAINRALEARLALVRSESDRLSRYLHSVQRSVPWRLLQTVRGWFGRKW